MMRPHQCGVAFHASRSAISVKAIGNASVETQTGTSTATIVRGLSLALDERQAADRKHHRDGGAGEARDDVRDVDRAFGKEFAGGQRQQLAFAGADGGAEQADPEREVERERPGARNAALQRLPHRDLRERQQHDAGEGESRDEVLDACDC